MNFIKKIIVLLVLLIASNTSFSQTKSTDIKTPAKKLVQFSGVVVENDSLKPIPFTAILIKGTQYGTVSDFYGFFTLVAKPGDEIQFISVGYKEASYIIPDTLLSSNYSIIQVMRLDTILLPSVSIYPWPSREEFKKAFLKLDVPNTDYDRAQKNLEEEDMRIIAKGVSMDAQGNYRYAMQQQYTKLYYAGQYPPNNLLNPVAWAKFIKAWKEGKLKRQ